MQRHKVRPGLTGWAQVNGLRGETQSVEKMKARIDYELRTLAPKSPFSPVTGSVYLPGDCSDVVAAGKSAP